MKIRNLVLILSFVCSTQAFAETYQRCTEPEAEKLLDQYQLTHHQNKSADDYSFRDCVIINPQTKLYLVAVSNPLATQSDNAGNYNLNLFLIDQQHQKIIQKYKHKDPIVPDTRFENLTFDINHYSTLADQNIIGLAINTQHVGGISHSSRYLNLYMINKHFNIQPVLTDFLTDFSAGMGPMGCDTAETSVLKRNLILLNSTSNGLQDIQINEKTEDTRVKSNCKVIHPILKRQHILKFNGQKYSTDKIHFLKYGL